MGEDRLPHVQAMTATLRMSVLGLLLALGGHSARAQEPQPPTPPVDFQREVLPLLADRCFRCHGPDAAARKRGLRLDTADGATAELRSGRRAVVPGDLLASELVRRIGSTDPDEVMPPPELHAPLSPAEQETLRRWVAAGAPYARHWAFVSPQRTGPGDIDDLVRDHLRSLGLAPAPPAEPAILLRRASLVLTGLPSTPEATAAFLADPAPDAFARQVDRLLASERCAEHLALDWLDLARFADTYGYQSDWECRVWPWRDWLLAALHKNLPHDQFVRELIAGDLLPDATQDQRLATAFQRLHRMTNEGGSIDEEFRREHIADRVGTYGTAFLGLTVECARCHDHKYDPITQADYYSLGAFFGAIDEAGTYPYAFAAVPRPALRLATAEQSARLAELLAKIADAEEALRAARAAAPLPAGPLPPMAPPVRRLPLDGDVAAPEGKAMLLDGDTGPTFADVPAFRRCDPRSLAFWLRVPDHKPRATVLHTSRFTIESDAQGYQVMLEDGRLVWEIVHLLPGAAASLRTRERFPLGRWVHVGLTYDGSSRAAGLRIFLDGEPTDSEVLRDGLDGPATVRTFQVGFRDRDLGLQGGAVDDVLVFDRELTALEVAELHRPGALAAATGELRSEYLRQVDPGVRAAAEALRLARAAHQDVLEAIPEIMVMAASPSPRPEFVLTRGQYDLPDRTRPVRQDRAIDALLPFDPRWPKDRLGLAHWTTDPRNPLTARVAVNRLWACCFGQGLVPTLENLGTQGDRPAHAALLDALAVDFVASGWDRKALLRRIVLSATFAQSSDAPLAVRERDPDNRLLARGPSFRLPFEVLRDQALLAAGLLVERLGGPSVKPWQPGGIWQEAGVSSQRDYQPDQGEGAHRRSLYTYRKRTAPPPNMLAFDAGSRELCLARRSVTNTPLQPLVLLNDPVFVECARALALRVAAETADSAARIDRAFLRLAAREPRSAEQSALRELHEAQRAAFAADPEAAALLLGQAADADLAALVLVCSTLLAADAVVTLR